jgi:hypothetical protein
MRLLDDEPIDEVAPGLDVLDEPAGIVPREEAPDPLRRRSLISRGSEVLRPQDQRIDRAARPGWVTGDVCEPRVGDEVYCTGGGGSVLRVHGRTGNGSRLLEVSLANGTKAPFFVASSNVLIAPRTEVGDA